MVCKCQRNVLPFHVKTNTSPERLVIDNMTCTIKSSHEICSGKGGGGVRNQLHCLLNAFELKSMDTINSVYLLSDLIGGY